MGERISLDNVRQLLSSVYREMFCYFQNEFQNYSPYLVQNGNPESIIGDLCKEATNEFIRFKSLHRTSKLYTI